MSARASALRRSQHRNSEKLSGITCRTVKFRMKDCRLLPEGPFGKESHHLDLTIRNQLRKFFGDE